MDWLRALNIRQAANNCISDAYGDWYRDPWGWPEYHWISQHPEHAVRRLNSTGAGRAAKLDVPKENFGIRPAIVMDPTDRVAYQALVDRLSISLTRDLRPWVHGWRTPRDEKTAGVYAKNDSEWDRFLANLSTGADRFPAALSTDIVSYFPSVSIDRLAERVTQYTRHNLPVARMFDMLSAWEKMPGRSGLPQRSHASSLLANVYLSSIDDVLDYYGRLSAIQWPLDDSEPALRWMDDIWLFGNDAGRLRRAQVELSDALVSLGLNLNIGKTRLLEGDAVDREAKLIEHSAVDTALLNDEPDLGPLEELIDGILLDPSRASRTTIRFATTRMRRTSAYAKVQDFVRVAPQMPHGADHLGRLFRDSGVWSELGDWYVTYRRGDLGHLDWSFAQLGTMFPTNTQPDLAVVEQMAEEVTSSLSLPVVALTAQRLSGWNRDLARVAIRDATRRADHPHLRRVLALAALECNEERPFLRRLLSEFEENSVTLSMLEDRDYDVPVRSDFTADR